MMSDEEQAARVHVVEGSQLITDTLTWLADQKQHHGRPTVEACLWMALAGLSVTVMDLTERHGHPTFRQALADDCDGAESALLMLRAVKAMLDGDMPYANGLATLAGKDQNA
jgi:hypothetical protein